MSFRSALQTPVVFLFNRGESHFSEVSYTSLTSKQECVERKNKTCTYGWWGKETCNDNP